MVEIKQLSLPALCEFLIQAKINTYAGDNAQIPSKSILSKNYLFEKDGFRYEDQNKNKLSNK